MKLLAKILPDPIFHFMILGSLLFVLDSALFTPVEPEYIIDIDQARIEWIKNTSKKENGHFPDEQSLVRLIDNDIQQEIFFREALSIELEKDDVIIRRRLIEKFTFMLEGITNNVFPTDEELQDFYLQNMNLFMQNERYSFSHYYFSEANRTNAQMDAEQALIKLTNTNTAITNTVLDNQKIGDPFMMRYHYENLSNIQLKNNFGKQFSEKLASEYLNSNNKSTQTGHHWFGPIESIYGWHLIKMTNVQSRSLPAYQIVKEKVLTTFMEHKRITANKAMYKQLLAKYKVNIAGKEKTK